MRLICACNYNTLFWRKLQLLHIEMKVGKMTNRVVFVNMEKIEELAKDRGLSISGLEDAIGVPHSTINRWRKRMGRGDNLKIVADYLGIKVDDILERR